MLAARAILEPATTAKSGNRTQQHLPSPLKLAELRSEIISSCMTVMCVIGVSFIGGLLSGQCRQAGPIGFGGARQHVQEAATNDNSRRCRPLAACWVWCGVVLLCVHTQPFLSGHQTTLPHAKHDWQQQDHQHTAGLPDTHRHTDTHAHSLPAPLKLAELRSEIISSCMTVLCVIGVSFIGAAGTRTHTSHFCHTHPRRRQPPSTPHRQTACYCIKIRPKCTERRSLTRNTAQHSTTHNTSQPRTQNNPCAPVNRHTLLSHLVGT
jgi:hypothetical protein